MASEKPKAQAFRRQSFKLEFNDVAQLLTPIMKRLNWRRLEIRQDLLRLTCIRSGSLDYEDKLRTFDYRATVTWARHPNGVEVLVTVTEPEYEFTQEECEKRCEEIIDAITLRIAKPV